MKTTRTIIGVAIMSALLALYIVFAAYQAALLVASGQPLTLFYGLALFVAPVIGIWSLVRELVFGRQAGRLLDRYTAENGDPQVPVINRRDRAAVDASRLAGLDASDLSGHAHWCRDWKHVRSGDLRQADRLRALQHRSSVAGADANRHARV